MSLAGTSQEKSARLTFQVIHIELPSERPANLP